MKFLLNMNVPRSLGVKLPEKGHSCRHVGDIGMARASDLEITNEAWQNNEVIVTHDLDYGHLLAFSGAAAPSVVIFRLRNINPDNLFSSLMKAWDEIEEPLLKGAIVTVEDSNFRIRNLPIVT
jgi:predicted nuclease of predicted toxin-antitoxin system